MDRDRACRSDGIFSWNSGRAGRGFVAAAEEIKRRAPFLAAPAVRIDKAELKDKEMLTYVTLTDEEPTASPVQQQMTINLLKTNLTKNWCKNPAMRGALDKGYVMTTVAKRVDGSALTKFSVGRVECICAEQGGDMCVIRY